jgi:hypothetical protein
MQNVRIGNQPGKALLVLVLYEQTFKEEEKEAPYEQIE